MTTRPNRVTRFAAVASLALAAMVAVPAVARGADEAKTDAPAARRGGGERQQQRDPAGRLEMFRKSLDRLDLTDEQTNKVDAAFDKAKADLQNLDESTDVRKRVDAFRDLRGKVMEVLTPEQRRKFEQNLRTIRPGGGEGPMAGGGQGLQRLRENLEKLGLTADQKKEVERITADSREKVRQVMGDANGDREEARKQMGEVFRDALQQIRETLTPEQQRKFRALMERSAADREGKSMADDDDKMMADGDMMMSDGDSAKGGKGKRAAAAAAVSAKPAGPKEPVDLSTVKFTRLDGRAVPISTYKGKPLVLIFGSYSCPSFREHAKGLDELQRRYAAKANFLLVYTKEAHPVGGWEVQRNKDAEISVPQAKDEAARLAAAKQARTKLGLNMATAVDSMDDQLVAAFDAFPNGAVILDREGQIAARQKWAEPRGLRILLDNLNNTSSKTPATRASAD
jgi:Spy/CpxP family protein refolding chaperone